MSGWGQTQLQVARTFQAVVAPLYRRRYPPDPTYTDERGRRLRLASPFYGWDGDVPLTYEAYSAAVDAGRKLPRPIHGPMHAARVTLFAGLLAVMHRRWGRLVGDLECLQVAAAFHDAAREDEGRDRWDADSGRLCGEWLTGNGFADGARWEAVLRDKDSHALSSLEQAVLHDADALDIQRVAHGRRSFDPARLWLTRMAAPVPPDCVRELTAEVAGFIAVTEDESFKNALEASPRYYIDVMHALTAAHDIGGALPLLNGLLDELLDS